MNAVHIFCAALLIALVACGSEPKGNSPSSRTTIDIQNTDELPRGVATVTIDFPDPETCSCYNVAVEWNNWCVATYEYSSVELANCFAEGESDFDSCKPANYPACLFAYWPDPN